MKKVINLFNSVPIWEKAVVIALFVIPIPGTLEGYLAIKSMTKIIKIKRNQKNKE